MSLYSSLLSQVVIARLVPGSTGFIPERGTQHLPNNSSSWSISILEGRPFGYRATPYGLTQFQQIFFRVLDEQTKTSKPRPEDLQDEELGIVHKRDRKGGDWERACHEESEEEIVVQADDDAGTYRQRSLLKEYSLLVFVEIVCFVLSCLHKVFVFPQSAAAENEECS